MDVVLVNDPMTIRADRKKIFQSFFNCRLLIFITVLENGLKMMNLDTIRDIRAGVMVRKNKTTTPALYGTILRKELNCGGS